jgi:hypothetical protein
MTWSGTRPQKLMRLARTLCTNPLLVTRALPGEARQWYQWHRGRDRPNLVVDQNWDQHLHQLLAAPWPCPHDRALRQLLRDIEAILGSQGWAFGSDTYAWYADGDTSLCRAAWCTTLHARPEVVVETGVAHGVTSRVILEALACNQAGHLWSIDLPFPFDQRLHRETGFVVTGPCRQRWSYLNGSSRQRLPVLTAKLGRIGLFVHDSLHTAANTLFEMEQVASAMLPGGVMLVDDIDTHLGFEIFARRHSEYQTIICPSADRQGLFGIAVRTPDL